MIKGGFLQVDSKLEDKYSNIRMINKEVLAQFIYKVAQSTEKLFT